MDSASSLRSLASPLFVCSYAFVAGVGMYSPSLWWLVIVGLAGLFYLLWFEVQRWRIALIYGFLFGCALGGGACIWMWDMHPFPGIPLPDVSQWILIGLVWGITALIAGVTTALGAVVLFILRTNTFLCVLAALVWVIQEEVRMWLYALYSYSPESLLGPHFSQTSLGYVLAESPYLLQLAHPFGIWALSGTVVLLASGLALFVRALHVHHTLQAKLAYVVCVLVLLVPLSVQVPEVRTSVRMSIVSTTDKTTDEEVQTLLEEAAHASVPADFILLPEGKRPRALSQDGYLARLLEGRDTVIVSADHSLNGNGSLSTRLLYDHPSLGRIGAYTKIFLMPQGEYVPSIASFLYPLSGDPTALDAADNLGTELVRGEELEVLHHNDAVIGGLVCSEVISPHLYHTLATHYGANVLVNLSNQSWFHESRTFHEKIIQIAKVHAVRERLYYVQATNDAPSFILDSLGRIVAETPWREASLITSTVALP